MPFRKRLLQQIRGLGELLKKRRTLQFGQRFRTSIAKSIPCMPGIITSLMRSVSVSLSRYINALDAL